MTTNSELKLEAEQLIADARLPELLSTYERWFIGGSCSWRDLDIYILDRTHELSSCFAAQTRADRFSLPITLAIPFFERDSSTQSRPVC